MSWWWWWWLTLAVVAVPPAGLAQAPTDGGVELSGLRRTRSATLLELLPRKPPAHYEDVELTEIERRIKNLEIFDSVQVTRVATGIRIEVREKWTLVPKFDLATGTTLKDSYVLLGLTDYNFLGFGGSLGFSVYHEQRGFGFHAIYMEHVYRRTRWAMAGETSYGSSEMRFRGDRSWFVNEAQVYLWTTSPPVGSVHARIELGLFYVHQKIDDLHGEVRPTGGNTVGGSVMYTWDAYAWHDLVPHGVSVNLSVSPGLFVGSESLQHRSRADLELEGAVALSTTTALLTRVSGAVLTRGNANHSALVGSIKGVRGLADTWYFNWIQSYVNLELRQALPLAERWALQFVLFSDAACFEQVDWQGRRDRFRVAFSGGGGVRLVPTWIANLVPRFDMARLLLPEKTVLYQFGVSQYF